MIKRFIGYYRPHVKMFIADMTCALLLALCDLFFPLITQNIIDDYIPNKRLNMLLLWVGILLVVYIVKMGFTYFVEYYGHVIGVRMQADMRRDVFEHLQRLPFQYFDDHKTGSIMSRIINDLMDISELAHHGPENLFLSFVLLIGSFFALSGINLWLTLIVFIFLPILITFSMKKRKKMDDAFTQTRHEVAEVNAQLENSISGIRVSKAFTNRDYEVERFQVGNGKFVVSRKNAYRVMAEFSCGNNFIIELLNVVVLLSGGIFTYYGQISFGEFTAFLLFVNVFLNPIRRLIGFIEQYQNGMSGFRRFVEIIETNPEKDAPDAVELESVKGDILFDNVSFAYNDSKSILSNVTLHIPQGKMVALVGPSGGGKTTLCHLIPRFYEVSGGEILLDGQNIQQITRQSLRRNIGLVAQDVFLFTGSIYENIAYGRVGATEEEVYEAAKRANIHEYIMSLPDGYQTYVGERGIKLSGGQKQRISIARVFLKNPPVLILDEATSALDNATELLIQASLEQLCQGRTTLVVAHRLSTIKNADEIIVITDDGIAERGSHDELLARDGIYAGLYQSQFKH